MLGNSPLSSQMGTVLRPPVLTVLFVTKVASTPPSAARTVSRLPLYQICFTDADDTFF